MTAPAQAETPLRQLAAVPGVVGSLLFDEKGELVTSEFPPVFDPAGLRGLARMLSGDGYYREWMAREGGALELRFLDGHVFARTVDRAWVLVLCTAQANAQLVSMSLTQVVRRLRAPDRSAEPPPASPSPLERLRAIVTAELGDHAAQALEILAAAGTKPRELVRAADEVEKLTRLFISRKKADELGRRMREILGG